MFRNESAGFGDVPLQDKARRSVPSIVPPAGEPGALRRHGPTGIVFAGLLATLCWMGFLGWSAFGWFRWMIG